MPHRWMIMTDKTEKTQKVPPVAPQIGDGWSAPNGSFIYYGTEMGWVDVETIDDSLLLKFAEVAETQARKYRAAHADLRAANLRCARLQDDYAELMNKYLDVTQKDGE